MNRDVEQARAARHEAVGHYGVLFAARKGKRSAQGGSRREGWQGTRRDWQTQPRRGRRARWPRAVEGNGRWTGNGDGAFSKQATVGLDSE